VGVFWKENYGGQHDQNDTKRNTSKRSDGESKSSGQMPGQQQEPDAGLLGAARIIFSDPTLLLLGAVQTSFEGSMHVFVLKWKPILNDPAAPLGG
jgi:hypothetical protein